MAINPDFRVKVRHFVKKFYKPFLIVLAIFILLVLINNYLIKIDMRESLQSVMNHIYQY